MSRQRFEALEAEHGGAAWPRSRYDAFKYAYSSGVVAVVLGEDVAALSGDLVDLYEQEPCLERAKDQFNNQEGRRLALTIHREHGADWRRRFAETIYDELRDRESAFSVVRGEDLRIIEICASD